MGYKRETDSDRQDINDVQKGCRPFRWGTDGVPMRTSWLHMKYGAGWFSGWGMRTGCWLRCWMWSRIGSQLGLLDVVPNWVQVGVLDGSVNPRPAGVWLVTRPAGGGPKGPPPPEISQTTGPISKFQTPFDSPVRELPVQGQIFDPEVTDDVTGKVKVRIFDFSGLATSASKISMLSAS